MFLGEVIKQRRAELQLTQEELCEGICDPITVSRMENGKQMPSYNRLPATVSTHCSNGWACRMTVTSRF